MLYINMLLLFPYHQALFIALIIMYYKYTIKVKWTIMSENKFYSKVHRWENKLNNRSFFLSFFVSFSVCVSVIHVRQHEGYVLNLLRTLKIRKKLMKTLANMFVLHSTKLYIIVNVSSELCWWICAINMFIYEASIHSVYTKKVQRCRRLRLLDNKQGNNQVL